MMYIGVPLRHGSFSWVQDYAAYATAICSTLFQMQESVLQIGRASSAISGVSGVSGVSTLQIGRVGAAMADQVNLLLSRSEEGAGGPIPDDVLTALTSFARWHAQTARGVRDAMKLRGRILCSPRLRIIMKQNCTKCTPQNESEDKLMGPADIVWGW
jgi:hypothetical protein